MASYLVCYEKPCYERRRLFNKATVVLIAAWLLLVAVVVGFSEVNANEHYTSAQALYIDLIN